MNLKEEIELRKIFVIILYFDVGKIILIEKLLYFSGVICEVGIVKGKKMGKFVISDWMKVE